LFSNERPITLNAVASPNIAARAYHYLHLLNDTFFLTVPVTSQHRPVIAG
jgi:hypothetical protein